MKNLKDYKQYWDKDFKTWFERNIKESTKDNWEDKLLKLAEKYCKHDDRDFNSCLYHIFLPFIKSQKELSFKKGVEKGRLLANLIRINNLKKSIKL